MAVSRFGSEPVPKKGMFEKIVFIQFWSGWHTHEISFLNFSCFIGQFSGECLEIIKNVGIKILPIRVYPKVTCKLVGKK
jgi:hypothetical protein